MTTQKQGHQETTEKQRDPDFIGAEIAMHRAAKRARRRAMGDRRRGGCVQGWENCLGEGRWNIR